MNYGHLVRAVESVVEGSGIGEPDDETPVQICVDGKIFKDAISVYLDDMNGRIVVIIEAAQ